MAGKKKPRSRTRCCAEFVAHSVRLLFALLLVLILDGFIIVVILSYVDAPLFQAFIPYNPSNQDDLDMTLCPAPPLNVTSVLDVGVTYAAFARTMEGLFFKYSSTIGPVFREMSACLEKNQLSKKNDDLLDRIDRAYSVGCIPNRTRSFAEASNQTVKDILKHTVVLHSYEHFHRYLGRHDALSFYYSTRTFNGSRYLKWDNITLDDFVNKIAVRLADKVKLRAGPIHATVHESRSTQIYHSRYAPRCARYRLSLNSRSGARRHKFTFDLGSPPCQQQDVSASGWRRRDFCHWPANVGLQLYVTTAGGFSELVDVVERTPLWVPLDRSTVVELRVSRKQRNPMYCVIREDENQLMCLQKCLVWHMQQNITCVFPWLKSTLVKYFNITNITDCGSYTEAGKTIKISNSILKDVASSKCWRHCSLDCEELNVYAEMAGFIQPPSDDSRLTLTLIMPSEMSHAKAVELPSWATPVAAVASFTAFLTGFCLVACSRWLLQLCLWLGGARRYLAAPAPLLAADLYTGRALRRARVAHRRLWRPRPERPWLRLAAGMRRDLRAVLRARAALLERVRGPRWWRPAALAALDTDSESDSPSSVDSGDEIDLRRRAGELRNWLYECIRGGCGTAAEVEVLMELEAELALEAELSEMGSARGLPGRASSVRRHSGQTSSTFNRSRRFSISMVEEERSAGGHGNTLLSALGGASLNTSHFGVSSRSMAMDAASPDHHRPSIYHQGPRLSVYQHGQRPSIYQNRSSVAYRGRRSTIDNHEQRLSVDQHGQRSSIDQHGQRSSIDQHGQRSSIDQHGQRPSVSYRGQRSTVDNYKQRPSFDQHGQRPSIGPHKQRPSFDQHGQRPSIGPHTQRPSVDQEGRRLSDGRGRGRSRGRGRGRGRARGRGRGRGRGLPPGSQGPRPPADQDQGLVS